jgi:NitT/TauT family transport system ATP-binding protein/nitrate/nitrite transport system substrate-binding protein
VTGSRDLRLGFVPLCDAAPLVVALEKGFFAAEDLTVSLSRELSWATVRDKVAAGALDGAHMLAPMTLATTLGAGGEAQAMIAPLALNRDGAAVTLSRRLMAEMGAPPAEGIPAALADLIARRRATGAPSLVFAVVFPYSMHNYILRFWLAQAGIDPDRDVRITVTAPPRMAGRLAGGELDGFCSGEPWNAVAVRDGAGEVAVRASQIWRAGPEKVLGVTEAWASRNPEVLQASMRAVLKAAAWVDAPANREELAELLARPDYVGTDAATIAGALEGITFHRDGANAPLPVQAGWLLSQMMRWGQVGLETDVSAVAARVYRMDLYEAAARSAGMVPVAADPVAGGFADGGTFRLDAARAYAAAFPIGRLAGS